VRGWLGVVVSLAALALVGGWLRGFKLALVSLVGLMVGLVLAGWLYHPVGGWLAEWLQAPPAMGRVAAYLLIMVAVQLGGLFLFSRLRRGRKIERVNDRWRPLGAVVGLIEAIVLVAIGLNLLVALPVSTGFKAMVADQPVAQPLIAAGGTVVYHADRLAGE
jgi:uncharacterized membrane protein required for colicin V production